MESEEEWCGQESVIMSGEALGKDRIEGLTVSVLVLECFSSALFEIGR